MNPDQDNTAAAVVLACRHCRCTEAAPCRLEADECVLNVQTRVCSNPRCQMAEIERKRKLRPKREHPFRVIERNSAGRAVRIVRNRKRGKGPAA